MSERRRTRWESPEWRAAELAAFELERDDVLEEIRYQEQLDYHRRRLAWVEACHAREAVYAREFVALHKVGRGRPATRRDSWRAADRLRAECQAAEDLAYALAQAVSSASDAIVVPEPKTRRVHELQAAARALADEIEGRS